MSNDSKIKDTINKLVSKYSKTSWGNILPAIFQTEEFDMALNQLVSDVQAGQPFTPHLNNLFKSMDLCKFEDVKVVFVNTYPTAGTDKPTGLAFAGGEPNSFTREINGITTTPLDNTALDYLPGQEGVLLLNASLTCPVGKPHDHLPMWQPVFDKLLADIAYKTTGTIFVFVGEEAKQFAKHVRKGQYRFFIPAVTQRNGWDPIDIFNRINSLLEITGKEPINW